MRFKNVKQNISTLLITGIILSLFAFTGCGGGGAAGGGGGGDDTSINYIPETKTNSYTGDSEEVFKVDTSGDVEMNYTLDLGSSTKDVIFIFTNTSISSDKTSPLFMNMAASEDQSNSFNKPILSELSSSSILRSANTKGKPDIADFNSNPWKYLKLEKTKGKKNYSVGERWNGPLKYVAGTSTNEFMNETTTDKIPATCRSVVTAHGRTLNIWVANDCWTGATSEMPSYVTQDMINEMASKFLNSGSDNIYKWVTNLYGPEWGTHSYDNLIAPNNEIHILLYDIDNDKKTNGGTLGFFWSKDNFKQTSVSYSNAKVMFYIDAILYSTKEDTSWEITDVWPQEMISTLAHEFQHMINFYQKNVVKGVDDSDTWINEMCSQVTEDIIADKLNVNGPRGVAYNNPGAGSSGNVNGRLPRFNYYNEAPLATWMTGSDELTSYSISYAFGAYLARNYNPATLFHDIVTGSYGDYRDVLAAVVNQGAASDITLGDIMKDWGVAVILSDKTSIVPSGKFRYNNGSSWMSQLYGDYTYYLGSINLFNYNPQQYLYSISDLNTEGTSYKSSNTYVYAGNLSGSNSWTFKMRDTVKLTVVVR